MTFWERAIRGLAGKSWYVSVGEEYARVEAQRDALLAQLRRIYWRALGMADTVHRLPDIERPAGNRLQAIIAMADEATYNTTGYLVDDPREKALLGPELLQELR